MKSKEEKSKQEAPESKFLNKKEEFNPRSDFDKKLLTKIKKRNKRRLNVFTRIKHKSRFLIITIIIIINILIIGLITNNYFQNKNDSANQTTQEIF